MRKKIVIGNWKMNLTPSDAEKLLDLLVDKCDTKDVDVVFCPPYLDVCTTIDKTKETNIKVGVQNMHFEDKGAYTGEVSADMIKEIGADYVIIGHSERREYFNETDVTVNKKVKKALEKDLIPVMCCGESLSERTDNVTLEKIRTQVKIGLSGVSAEDITKLILAYEPIWAIGTGKVATEEQAEEVCFEIRKLIEELYDENTAQNVRILYGGSVNKTNVKALFSQKNIDGALVGGASLKEEFIELVNVK